MNYGATKEEWSYLDIYLELTEDLLPVVSNPTAKISPNSKMKEKGKTPSKYNYKREVAGLPNWTQYKATTKDMTLWQKEPDYGVCLQTRYVRALDFDISTNRAVVTDFVDSYTKEYFGFLLPLRNRIDSSKSMMLYRLKGEYPKRVVKVRGGMVENLNNGQQAILAGTHPKGQRYQLDMRDNKDIPEITEEQANNLWKIICEGFQIEKPSEGSLRRRGETTDTMDEVVQHLTVKGVGKDGQLFIDCPFKSEHSMDGGDAETAYFPAGTGGYVQGHFACFHSHCASRSDSDFLDTLGITDKIIKFEPIKSVEKDENGRVPLAEHPSLDRDKKGIAALHEHNLKTTLNHAESFGYLIKYDQFLSAVMIARCDGDKNMLTPLRSLEDEDYFALKLRLGEMNFKTPIRTDMLREAINYTAWLNKFDSAQDWLNNLPEWDGIPRVETFLVNCFGAEDNEYSRAVSKYWLTAHAGRILTPGVKADMMPILEGCQGFQKSWALKALLPSDDLYGNINLSSPDDKNIRLMSGKMLCEMDEVKGLHNRELESIKSFMTITADEHIPKYKEKPKQSPRRCIFVGTTNKKELLVDETGNRRFLPIEVTKADRKRIKEDRDMLWAEAKVLYDKAGVFWQAEQFAGEAHDKYKLREVWEDNVRTWIYEEDMDGITPLSKGYVTTSEILQGAIQLETAKRDPRHFSRIAKALLDIGFEQKLSRIKGINTRIWILKSENKVDDLI